MESVIVNARVPAAKRDFARSILEEIGATPTDLINSAFDYVIAERTLPHVQDLAEEKSEKGFRDFLMQASLNVDWGNDGGKSYKELVAQGRIADYESLA